MGKVNVDKNVVYLKRAKIRREKRRRRIVVGVTTGVVALGIVGCNVILNGNSKDKKEEVTTSNSVVEEYVIDTSTEDLSSLNIVLVNDGISDEQIAQAESSLEATGLEVEVRDISELNKNGTECFVALTNYQGDDYKVIGNYNSGNNQADLLAIGMKASFGGNIQRGVKDISQVEPTFVPSAIENAVSNQMMPNVTIAVPYDANLSNYYVYDNEVLETIEVSTYKNFTDCFLEGLARYDDSLKNIDDIYGGEFLLRPTASDYVDSLNSDVLKLNGLENSYKVQDDSILLNIGLPKSFNKTTAVNIGMTDVKSNSLN